LKLDSFAIIAAVDIHIIADGPHSGSTRAKASSKSTGAIVSLRNGSEIGTIQYST
jgi:hypothetical protein